MCKPRELDSTEITVFSISNQEDRYIIHQKVFFSWTDTITKDQKFSHV